MNSPLISPLTQSLIYSKNSSFTLQQLQTNRSQIFPKQFKEKIIPFSEKINKSQVDEIKEETEQLLKIQSSERNIKKSKNVSQNRRTNQKIGSDNVLHDYNISKKRLTRLATNYYNSANLFKKQKILNYAVLNYVKAIELIPQDQQSQIKQIQQIEQIELIQQIEIQEDLAQSLILEEYQKQDRQIGQDEEEQDEEEQDEKEQVKGQQLKNDIDNDVQGGLMDIQGILRKYITQGLELEKKNMHFDSLIIYDKAYQLICQWSREQNYIEIHPELIAFVVELFCLKGLILFHFNRNDEAIFQFQSANKCIKDFQCQLTKQAYLQVGNANLKTKESEQAIMNFKKVLIFNEQDKQQINENELYQEQLLQSIYLANKVDPKNIDYLVQFGQRLKSLGRIEEAEEKFKKALEFDPLCEQANINLGMIEEDKNSEESLCNALQKYNRALEINNHNFQTLFRKGVTHRKLKTIENLKSAIEAFTQAINQDSFQVECYLNRGQLQFELKNYNESYFDFDCCLFLDEKHIEALFGKSNSLRKLKKYREAILNYQKVIEICSSLFNEKNSSYNQELKKIHILSYIYKAISISKQNPNLIPFEQNVIKFQKELRAIESLNFAANLDPQNEEILQEVFFQRGKILMRMEMYEEAKQDFDKCKNRKKQKEKNYLENIQELQQKSDVEKGNYFLKEEKLDEAQRLFEITIEKTPNDLQALIGLGDVMLKKNLTEQANNYYQQAADEDETQLIADYKIALIEIKLKNNEKTLEKLKQILEKLNNANTKCPVINEMKENILNMIFSEERLKEFNKIIEKSKKNENQAEVIQLVQVYQEEKEWLFEQTCKAYQLLENAKKLNSPQIANQIELTLRKFKSQWEEYNKQSQILNTQILELSKEQQQIQQVLNKGGVADEASIRRWMEDDSNQLKLQYVKAFYYYFMQMREQKNKISSPPEIPFQMIPLFGPIFDAIQKASHIIYQQYAELNNKIIETKMKKIFVSISEKQLQQQVLLAAITIADYKSKSLTFLEKDFEENTFFVSISQFFRNSKKKQAIKVFDSIPAQNAIKDTVLIKTYFLANTEVVINSQNPFFKTVNWKTLKPINKKTCCSHLCACCNLI